MKSSTSQFRGFSFQELLTPAGLSKLDNQFLHSLEKSDVLLHDSLLNYRAGHCTDPKEMSQLLIDVSPVLETFIAELFNIQQDVLQLQAKVRSHDPIFEFKKHFVLREARRALKQAAALPTFEILDAWLTTQLKQHQLDSHDREWAVAHFAQKILAEPEKYSDAISQLVAWCVQALHSDTGKEAVLGWVSFHSPGRLDYGNLVNVEPVGDELERLQGSPRQWRHRDGFKLTDERMTRRQVLDEAHYCVYCHKTDGDFCSKGFPVKKTAPEMGLKRNPLNEILTGCPLEEKISEMHFLKKSGYNVAALAVVMIDNPMCPATGHRICNDCMKACIYQKQEPVNIPQIETRVLTDVLELPFGVEIYDLFTRWNPLRKEQWIAKPYNGKKVLVMGMGPAGFTLAHHLLMEGCAVVGTDGLKIEPLPSHYVTAPIRDYSSIKEALDNRLMAGFGGVAEYGITVRWDKNFLKLIYISLMRRPYFQVYGSVRFGGTLQVEDAWTLGFDHLAVAVGAGLPRELIIPNSLASGMRQANDFLMALQLTGAAKFSSLANLEVRLPAVVIGGGLTGVDTATEVQAYYIAQVEKTAHRYRILSEYQSAETVRRSFDERGLAILDEFLQHAHQVQEERERASREHREPDFISLIREWGGVTIAYRRNMQESPAYRRNHEEVSKAFEEGIYYAEGLEPDAVILDESGAVSALKCRVLIQDEEGRWHHSDAIKTLPARAIFVATGAKPNIAYEFEHRGTFVREENNYQRFEEVESHLQAVRGLPHVKAPEFGPFTSYQEKNYRVSFLGDTHPVFHGSVVKAIASAKRVYPAIIKKILQQPSFGHDDEYHYFKQQMLGLFNATVCSVTRQGDDLIELVVRAPMAAKNFRPGQFYRLQNYEASAIKVDATCLQTEAMALLASKHLPDSDLLSFLILERGVSSRLVATFQSGDPIAVMGPTGVNTKIPETPETIMIVGGTMAIAQLRSLSPVLRSRGHRILFVACMESEKSVFNREEIEKLSDVVLWVTATGSTIKNIRAQDHAASGELILALRDYALGQKKCDTMIPTIRLQEINRVIVVGSAELLRRMQQGRNGLLRPYFQEEAKFFGSVYGAMQCMLKGVCAQCLQWQVDPITGKRTKAVYACSWQEQPMEMIDIAHIDERLNQNKVQERLSNQWLDYLFAKYDIIKI